MDREELLEEMSSTEAVEVSMIESAANEIGQLGGASFDRGFIEEEDSEFYGSYCLEIKDTREDSIARNLLRLGYEEMESEDVVRGFVRGRIVVMVNSVNGSVFVYVDYDDMEDSELEGLDTDEYVSA